MGIESRDWYREDPVPYLDDAPARGVSVSPVFVAALLIVLVVTTALGFRGLSGTGRGDIEVRPLLGPAVAVDGPYPFPDDWHGYLADERTCPGGGDVNAPLQRQAQTMVCLINYARARAGLTALAVAPQLSQAARLKAEQIQRCGAFAHAPCGGDAHDVVDQARYEGAFGENLYIAEGGHGAPRVALDGWLNSPGHRENVFRPEWRVQSLYVVKLERFREYHDATLWVSHFGDR